MLIESLKTRITERFYHEKLRDKAWIKNLNQQNREISSNLLKAQNPNNTTLIDEGWESLVFQDKSSPDTLIKKAKLLPNEKQNPCWTTFDHEKLYSKLKGTELEKYLPKTEFDHEKGEIRQEYLPNECKSFLSIYRGKPTIFVMGSLNEGLCEFLKNPTLEKPNSKKTQNIKDLIKDFHSFFSKLSKEKDFIFPDITPAYIDLGAMQIVKLRNFMLDKDENLKLIDFGLPHHLLRYSENFSEDKLEITLNKIYIYYLKNLTEIIREK